MVVPRSAIQVAADDEFALLSVVTFKKHSIEFIHKCREKRWTPRDYKYKEGGKEEEAKEVGKLEKDERKLWGEAIRLGRTGYSESAMIWIHVLALRVFVETVLRYGLPLDFVCGLVQVRMYAIVPHVRCAHVHRQMRNSRRRRRRISTLTTRTLAEMPLVEIAKAASRRMTRLRLTICRQRAIWGIRSTRHMYTTSLNLHSAGLGMFWLSNPRDGMTNECRLAEWIHQAIPCVIITCSAMAYS